VIDSINPINSGRWHAPEDTSYADRDLRGGVLSAKLGEITGNLMLNLRPSYKVSSGDEYEPTLKSSLYLVVSQTVKT
jgi:hypothetical protein